jgi:acyl-coenzyme A synthetase/AMP-(fatty) acid ligase
MGPEGARMYRSGDLGLWRADGGVEYRGRNDSQVKVRGFRVELGEVESHLAALEGVHEAVALVQEDSAGEGRLVAYLTANPGAKLIPSELRGNLLRRLPVHMVPTDFVILQQFPLNSSGKIDRKALAVPEDQARPTMPARR